MPSNTNDRGYIRVSASAPCQNSSIPVNDPIRTGLVNGGVSAADLANYDAAASGAAIRLTSINTIAKLQALRTAAIAAVTGSYRIGNLDAEFDVTPTGGGGPILTASATTNATTIGQCKMTANTAPYLIFVTTGTNNSDLNSYRLRKGNVTYTTTLINQAIFVNDAVAPFVVDNATIKPYSAVVIKKPTTVDSVDRNTAMFCQGTIGYNSAVSSSIGNSAPYTSLTTNNIYNRQWQALCAAPTVWA